jgi:hypothetical protein
MVLTHGDQKRVMVLTTLQGSKGQCSKQSSGQSERHRCRGARWRKQRQTIRHYQKTAWVCLRLHQLVGKTLGSRAASLRVIDFDGGRIDVVAKNRKSEAGLGNVT